MKKRILVSVSSCILFLACSGGGGNCSVNANGAKGQVIINYPGGQVIRSVDANGNVTYPGNCAPPGHVVITQP